MKRSRTAQPTPLWLSEHGSVSCSGHLPTTAAAGLEKRPAAQQLTSDTVAWHRLSKADFDSLQAMSKHEPACEQCLIERHQART